MKLSPRDAIGWARKPGATGPGALISGEDPTRAADLRRIAALAIAGPDAEAEMRITRIAASDLRKDLAHLTDSLRSSGFFPGPRLVLVEDATDGLAPAITAALDSWQPGDAKLIVTAGALPRNSALRKLFEGHKTAVSITLYDDPPGPDEVAELARQAGLDLRDPGGREALIDLARGLDGGAFRQTLTTLSLYLLDAGRPVTAADVAALAPLTAEAEADDLLDLVGGQKAQAVVVLLSRLYGQGIGPVTICIAALRHFRALLVLATEPGDPGAALFKLRPPPRANRRDKILMQARDLGRARIEKAMSILIDTDLELRSASHAPQTALVERALLRIAHLPRP